MRTSLFKIIILISYRNNNHNRTCFWPKWFCKANRMDKIYLFNPETEILLASDSPTPLSLPKPVNDFISGLQLLPAIYAEEESGILIREGEPEKLSYYPLIREKKLNILRPSDLKCFSGTIIPWGWNRALRNQLRNWDVCEASLPDEEMLTDIRHISHRRSTILINKDISLFAPGLISNNPKECFSIEDCASFAFENNGAYFKSPWSSSGRGVFKTGQVLSAKDNDRISAVVRKQGSILAEKIFPGKTDFATEWMIEKGKAVFKGFSFFNISGVGKYSGNLLVSDNEGLEIIKTICSEKPETIIEAQRFALQNLLEGRYEGPAGIDMMADEDGNVCGCVELNLRMTMGHVALYARDLFPRMKMFVP